MTTYKSTNMYTLMLIYRAEIGKYLLYTFVIFGFFIFLTILFSACDKSNSRLPNVIIIFTDDQGYGDVGCFGAQDFSTPNLDKLAEEGVRFTNFYTAASVCTPSRAALLTGCYPPRVSITKVAFPEGPAWTKDLSNFANILYRADQTTNYRTIVDDA